MINVQLQDLGLASLSGYSLDWPTYTWNPWSYWFEYLEVEIPPIDALALAGHANPRSSNDVYSFFGYHPTGRGATEAFQRWSGFVSNFRHFFTDWQFGAPPSDDERHTENPVNHVNLRGDLFGGQTPYNRFRPQGYFTLDDYDVVTTAHVISEPNQFSLVLDGPSGGILFNKSWRFCAMDFLGQLETGGFDLIAVPNTSYWTTWVKYSNVQYRSIDEYVVSLCFDEFIASLRVNGIWYASVNAVKINILRTEISDYKLLNQSFNIRDVCHIGVQTVKKTYWVENQPSSSFDPFNKPWNPLSIDDPSWISSTPYWGGNGIHELSVCFTGNSADPPKHGDLLGIDQYGRYVNAAHKRGFRDFEGFSAQLVPNVAAGFVLSSQDAVDKAFSAISSNSLENLAQLGELMEIVDVERTLALVRYIRGRKYASALLTLLDLLANYQLVYSFGIRPTVSDSIDFSKKAGRILRSIHRTSYYDARGKFHLDVPEDFNQSASNFPGTTIEHRSKIVFRVNPDSYLSAMIPLRSFGLLPTVSQLWDFVPFSFVLDWFLNLGNTTSMIENSAMMLALDVKTSVHSAAIHWPFPTEWLEEFNLYCDSAPNAYRPGYVFYDREVLSILPTPAPTRLPYYGVGHLPSWEVPTSLFWSLISR